MHLFENQIVPVRIHNISKSFKPNLDTIRVLSLGTKFIPKWEKTKTSQTFKWFNNFKNKLNRKFLISMNPNQTFLKLTKLFTSKINLFHLLNTQRLIIFVGTSETK